MESTYYRILGVNESASEDEIKQEYRKIAKKYHPDTNPGNKKAEERFKEAGDAYEVLGNPDKRKAYDKELEQARGRGRETSKSPGKKPGAQGMAGFDFGNMSANFEQFFGFQPVSDKIDEEKLNANKKKRTNPMDMTDMFERYMGMKK